MAVCEQHRRWWSAGSIVIVPDPTPHRRKASKRARARDVAMKARRRVGIKAQGMKARIGMTEATLARVHEGTNWAFYRLQ